MAEVTNSPVQPEAAKSFKFRYPLVVCVWDDAESDVNWQDEPTGHLEPTLATTVGFLIRDENNYVLIADAYIVGKDNKMTIGNTTKIPRGMIKNLDILKLVQPRKKKQKAAFVEEEKIAYG